jgi:hypothetical protein
MTKNPFPFAAALAVTLVLAACNNEPIAADERADPTAAEVAAGRS